MYLFVYECLLSSRLFKIQKIRVIMVRGRSWFILLDFCWKTQYEWELEAHFEKQTKTLTQYSTNAFCSNCWQQVRISYAGQQSSTKFSKICYQPLPKPVSFARKLAQPFFNPAVQYHRIKMNIFVCDLFGTLLYVCLHCTNLFFTSIKYVFMKTRWLRIWV